MKEIDTFPPNLCPGGGNIVESPVYSFYTRVMVIIYGHKILEINSVPFQHICTRIKSNFVRRVLQVRQMK